MSEKRLGLVITCPSACTDENLPYIDHFVGIEFLRGDSRGGSGSDFVRMIGNEKLLADGTIFNAIHCACVKNGKETLSLTPNAWRANQVNGDYGDVNQCFPDMYWIEGGSDPMYERWIVSTRYFEYQGDKAKLKKAWGDSADYAVIDGSGALRCMRNDTVNGFSASGGTGTNYSENVDFGSKTGLGYPTVNKSRYEFEAAARAANGTNDYRTVGPDNVLDRNFKNALMFIELKTKHLNNVFGTGISSNQTPNASNWGSPMVSGCKITPSGGGAATYASLSNKWTEINGQYPLLKCLEAQLAVSGGATLHPVQDAEGNTIPTSTMTGIWVKDFSYTNGDGATVEVHLCVPLWRGSIVKYGNIWFQGSGVEFFTWKDEDQVKHLQVFLAKDVESMMKDSSNDTTTFPGYEDLGEIDCKSGYAIEMLKDRDGNTTLIPRTISSTATLYNYESAYLYASDPDSTTKERRAAFVGGPANLSFSGVRCVIAYLAPSHSYRNYGSGSRVAISA